MFDRVEELPVPWVLAGEVTETLGWPTPAEATSDRGPRSACRAFTSQPSGSGRFLKGRHHLCAPRSQTAARRTGRRPVSPAKAPAWSVCSAGHARWFSSTPRPSRDAHVSWPTPAAPIAFE